MRGHSVSRGEYEECPLCHPSGPGSFSPDSRSSWCGAFGRRIVNLKADDILIALAVLVGQLRVALRRDQDRQAYAGLPRSSVQRKLKVLLPDRPRRAHRRDDGPYRIPEHDLSDPRRRPSLSGSSRSVARRRHPLGAATGAPKWAPRRFPSPWFKGNRGGLRQVPLRSHAP